MYTLDQHPRLADLVPYLYVQHGSGLNGARHRIEVKTAPPEALVDEVNSTTQCAECGAAIMAIRRRAGWGTCCVSVTCRLEDEVRCARTGAARKSADAVRAAVEAQPQDQPMLFT